MKIFNIHLNKSGSSSFSDAMKILGFKGYHWKIKDKVIRDWVLKNGFNGLPRFDFLSDFGDGVEPKKIIPLVEKEFPDAKFVLTYREKNDWLKSLEKHKGLIGNYFNKSESSEFYDKVINYYENHFKDKNNLLVLPVDAKNKWELLCEFVGKPVPLEVNYPHALNRKEKKYYKKDNDYSTLEEYKENNNDLWGITTYFNPKGYANKLKNYKKFRKNSNKQGLNLITVECAFGEQPFILTKDDAEILIQVRSNSVLWQKERLLNIGLNSLPEECKYVAWLDADIIFLNNNWIKDTVEKLNRYNVVQLFDIVIRLEYKQMFNNKNDFALGYNNSTKRIGAGVCFEKSINPDVCPMTGIGWAIRKDIIKQIGFFDKLILGSGDGLMAQCFMGKDTNHIFEKTPGLNEDEIKWNKKVNELVNKSVSFVDGVVLHLYHGELENRFYNERYDAIKEFNLSPDDILLNDFGCWEWNTNKTGLIKYAEDYFGLRKEDKRFIINNKLILELIASECNFMQVGANDGLTNDQFYYYLKNSNCNGLFVEPVKDAFEKLKENYKGLDKFNFFNGAVSKQNKLELYTSDELSAVTSINKEHVLKFVKNKNTIKKITVPCKTVDYLVKKYLKNKLDLLIVDTECFDDEVIYTCDLDNLKPKIIYYEFKNLTKEKDLALENYLKLNGYNIEKIDEIDKIAIKKETIYNNYYKKRNNLNYYGVVKDIVNKESGETIVDVGANDTDIVLSGDFKNRVVVDKLNIENKLNDVEYIVGDYLEQDIIFADLVLCLQVIEHVENPKEFVQKLLKQGKKIVVSIPYKWDKHKCKYHLQDPVDDDKMFDWFLIKPVWTKEINDNNNVRKIYCYEGLR